jgi:hypothetical protein
MEGDINKYKVLVGETLQERDHLEDLGVGG